MLIPFWCDSEITFLLRLHKKNGNSTVFISNYCILVAKFMWGCHGANLVVDVVAPSIPLTACVSKG